MSGEWRSQSDSLVPLCKFHIITIIHLEIDCFHNQSTVNICIAGLNRWAGHATVSGEIVQIEFYKENITENNQVLKH